jgi:serine/threonine-protein kinase
VPKPVSAVNRALPAVFDAVVARALDKASAKRYTSAVEFQQALRASWESVAAHPPSPTMSDRAKMIATAIGRHPVGPKAARPPSGPGPPPAPQVQTPISSASRRPRNIADSGSLAAWSREQLAEIERHLSAIMGPVARVLVQDAAATTASRKELYQLLANRLQTPEERRRFLQAGGESAASVDTGGTPQRATNAIVFSNIVGRPLTSEATQRATVLLARYLGPIAGILTRKAAQTATDEAQLYALLAEKVPDTAERERFIKEAGRPRR